MNRTPAATNQQLARAEALGKALAHRGFTGRREPQDTHPGAIAATAYTRSGIRVLILTLGGRHGQMIEITAEATTGYRGEAGRRVREVKPSWRLTAYDAPTEAITTAATAAFGDPADPSPLEGAGWTVEHALARNVGRNAMSYTAETAVPPSMKVRATRFTRPDGMVCATFHIPTYTPPCEHCDHHRELGDTGGWDITGPGFTAEATAHTPAAGIGALVRALASGGPSQAAAAQGVPRTTQGHQAKPIPAAAMSGTRLTAVVC